MGTLHLILPRILLLIYVTVVTPSRDGSTIETHKNKDLLIVDGKMAGITPSQSTYSEPVFDASGCLATPGFVDAHTHLFPPNDRAEEFVIRYSDYITLVLTSCALFCT